MLRWICISPLSKRDNLRFCISDCSRGERVLVSKSMLSKGCSVCFGKNICLKMPGSEIRRKESPDPRELPQRHLRKVPDHHQGETVPFESAPFSALHSPITQSRPLGRPAQLASCPDPIDVRSERLGSCSDMVIDSPAGLRPRGLHSDPADLFDQRPAGRLPDSDDSGSTPHQAARKRLSDGSSMLLDSPELFYGQEITIREPIPTTYPGDLGTTRSPSTASGPAVHHEERLSGTVRRPVQSAAAVPYII